MLTAWTKPKSNEIAAFTKLKQFKQGTLSLFQLQWRIVAVHSCISVPTCAIRGLSRLIIVQYQHKEITIRSNHTIQLKIFSL